MRHFRYRSAQAGPDPSLFFEIKLDWQDVRCGQRFRDHLFLVATWLDGELTWTRDMVTQVDPTELQEMDSAPHVSWPVWADTKAEDYLTRFYRREVWRNFRLSVFSGPDESRTDFVRRCEGEMRSDWGTEQRQLKEVFLRRFLQLEEWAIQWVQSDETASGRTEKDARVRTLFFEAHESLSRCFLVDGLRRLSAAEVTWSPSRLPEVEERLSDFRLQLVEAYNKLREEYGEMAASVERYEVAVPRHGIEIVDRGMVWPG